MERVWIFGLAAAIGVAMPASTGHGDSGRRPALNDSWEAYGYEDEASLGATEAVPRLFENMALPPDLERGTDVPSTKRQGDEKSMQDLERKINLLRGQIQDTKSLILELGENISEGFVTSTKLLVLHRNVLGKAFKIESVEYKLDGFTIYTNDEPKKLEAAAEMIVFDASVLPGNHTLDVIYTLRATGYGIFTYMEEYRFDMRNQYYFAAPKGKAVELTVEAVDRGAGETLRERPMLKFAVR